MTVRLRFSDDDVARFAAWSSDRNPLHVDAEFARQTHFGRPIVHGVLTVIESLQAAGLAVDDAVTTLDIEFRSAVVAGHEYEVARRDHDGESTITLLSGGQPVLNVRVETGPLDGSPIADAAQFVERSAGAALRDVPATRTIDELEAGVEVLGSYCVSGTSAATSRAGVSDTHARVLALCSYVTGMELPGLKSLFTRLTVRFHGEATDSSELRFRARTVRCDRRFRMLETDLQVITPGGRHVATAVLRSYVPYSPATLDLDELADHLTPAAAELRSRVALVIGASRGLGAELAASLALAGAHVYAAARRADATTTALFAALAERGCAIEFLQGDARDAAWCDAAVEAIRARHGRLDLLVLSACEPPSVLHIGRETAAQHRAYVDSNLELVTTPLTTLGPAIATAGGAILYVSSSFVEEAPKGFGHYVALKRAAEGLLQTASREWPQLSVLVARPPMLQTRWNDTPAGVVSAIPSNWAASHLVNRLAENWRPGSLELVTAIPSFEPRREKEKQAGQPDLAIRLAATFTTDPLVGPLRFWLRELDLHAALDIAPYGQVLQSLLDPGSAFNAKGRGLNVVLLRVRDWLRELPEEQLGDIEFVRSYLQDTLRDFERAVRTHRAHAPTETLLLVSPSHGALSSAESILVRQIEQDLASSLAGVPGLQIAAAADFHAHYGVDEDAVYDALRDEIAHIPYHDEYLHVLATLVVRQLHQRLAPARKVVVVDCDNTLWRGVVGEVGAEGVAFEASHRALHAVLERLAESGVLVCLCSKNEEFDVWRVFETRTDMPLRRERVVAAMINWLPKSQNLRTLAGRLNLGLDSFVFIDDNPVECAEVRAACPEVLTVQWPDDGAQAVQLLQHFWEFDPRAATKEDARRTDMYREEFRRQELRAETLTFDEFINSLQLVIDFSPLVADDLRRAAQLTLRTNQFNFTTIRREETDVQALATGGRHEIRTVRVRDRFGDYGLVGLLIAERGEDVWTLDTFLLSCRVLGRGVEHRILAQLGELAAAAGARAVKMRVETTKRNQPARTFFESVVPAEYRRDVERGIECEVPAGVLASVRFEPAGAGELAVQEDGGGAPSAQPLDAARLRRREAQIARAAFELATGSALRAAVDGRPAPGVDANRANRDDVKSAVLAAFSAALRQPEEKVAEVDRLEALGCDSLKIVEITVALSEKFPWLPGTLLFEHRAVSAIVNEIERLTPGAVVPAVQTSGTSAPQRLRASASADIAVVGMHLRCAGANSPAELWELLSNGVSAVRPVPIDRAHFLQALADTRPHWAGLLEDPARFDPEAFGVSPREAEFMDPQLRLFVEVAWNALEDAGVLGADHDPNTGVFAGVMYADYAFRANLAPVTNANPYRSWEGFSLANRLSQLLGFGGPSLAVDTACSSSGTALHLACHALNADDCRVAVVGGVNLILDSDRLASLGRLGILSERGRCEPFGGDADGTVLGEGAGVVVLRRLDDALERGDRIYGVIKGTGLSTGNGTVGFTAPNPQAQADAIRRSLRRAGLDPRTVSYIETHGTGTHLGDPIEVRGLTLGYGAADLQEPALPLTQRTRIGSIKANIGHLEAGAGVMGLIKVLLQLQHGMLLPSITSPEPNPQIAFARGHFDVQTRLEPWQRSVVETNGTAHVIPRRAGISSFGVGGANAHVLVEEPPAPVPQPATASRPSHVLALSARSESALQRQAATIARYLETAADESLQDICFSINTGRKQFAHRLAVVASTREELQQSLAAAAAGAAVKRGARGVAPASAPKMAFLFTGQGSQYAGMGKHLYETQPVFRDALDRCAIVFDRLLDRPLFDLLFAAEGTTDAELLNQTGYTQPALFALQYALCELWASWGLRPDVVMGHSVGEIAALCVAGGVSLEDGLKLIAARGRFMQALPAGGTMTSVMADEARVQAAIAGAEELVAIAAINAPEQVVISGDGAAVAEIAARLTADGIKTKSLTVSHAFHSPLMKPMLAEYERVVREIRFTPPRVPFVSCVEGALVHDEVTRVDYWLRQVMDPVRFASGMSTLQREQVSAYVEIGPHPVLLGMGRQCIDDAATTAWMPSMRRDTETWQTLLASLATLYVNGSPVDWRGFDAPYSARRTTVPGYAFNQKPYWLKRLPVVSSAGAGREVTAESHGADTYEIAWRQKPLAEPAKVATGPWVVLSDGSAMAAAVVEALRAASPVTIVSRGNAFAARERELVVNASRRGDVEQLWQAIDREHGTTGGVVSFWSSAAADSSSPDLATRSTDALVSLMNVVQTLAAHGVARPTLWVVTRGAIAVDSNSRVEPFDALSWGFGRTVSLEHPELWGGLIDVDDDPTTAPMLARELLSAGAEDQVALRGADRYVPRLVRRAIAPAASRTLSPEATYLVTGGVGALGLHTAEWLVARGARRLVLTSRRGVPDAGATARIKVLEQGGAHVSVIAADVSRVDDVRRVLEIVAGSGAPLRGVVHAAGVDAMSPLRELTTNVISDVVAGKVVGADLLHDLTRSMDLDLFVCVSSIAAVFGSQGRAHYAAANAYLDGLIERRRAQGLCGTSINFGPWAGAGMASGGHLDQFERVGNRGLDPQQAIELIDRIVAADVARASVMDIDWPTFAPIYESRRTRPLIAELTAEQNPEAAGADAAADASTPPWIAQLRQVSNEQRGMALTALLRAEVAETLGFEDAESVASDANFYELGMDSLMVADFVSRLKQRLGTPVTAVVFNHPNVTALSAKLIEAISLETASADGTPAPAGASPREEQAEVGTPAATSGEPSVRTYGYAAGLEPEVFAFQSQAWPHRDQALNADRWRWMFVESARRLGVEPRVWLHRDGPRVVAHMGSIAVRLKLGAQERNTGWLVDTMVLEPYRSLALGSRLMVEAHDDQPFSLSLGQTAEMRAIQLRLGWREVAPLQIAQSIVRATNVLKGKLPTPAAWAAGLGLEASAALRRLMREPSRLEVRRVDRFDHAHDQLWHQASADLTTAVVRDASYLNWKYCTQPGQTFLALDVSDAGERLGVAVWMLRDADDAYAYRRAYLVDFVARLHDSAKLRAVLTAACTAAADAGADALVCMHTDARLSAALRGCGFHLRKPERFLLVDPGPLTGDALEHVLAPQSWYITQGDSDIDRPRSSLSGLP